MNGPLIKLAINFISKAKARIPLILDTLEKLMLKPESKEIQAQLHNLNKELTTYHSIAEMLCLWESSKNVIIDKDIQNLIDEYIVLYKVSSSTEIRGQ
jgi:hypothetical protein